MLMKTNKFYQIENKIERIVFATEDNIEKEYKRAADALKKEIAELDEQLGQLTIETMNKYNRLEALERKMIDVTQGLYQANRKEINASLRRTFVETSRSIMTVVDEDTGRRLQPITKSKKVTEVINSKVKGLDWRDRMGKHQADAIYELKKEIGAGITDGDTYATIAKRIQKTFDVNESKAKTIARNEVARVKSASEKDTMDEVARAGVKMTKTWNNVKDERSRGARRSDQTNHIALDGVTVPYEDEFDLGGGVKAEAPRLTGVAKHDINCRCFLSYSFNKGEGDGSANN